MGRGWGILKVREMKQKFSFCYDFTPVFPFDAFLKKKKLF
jgi:hypothetical protein